MHRTYNLCMASRHHIIDYLPPVFQVERRPQMAQEGETKVRAMVAVSRSR